MAAKVGDILRENDATIARLEERLLAVIQEGVEQGEIALAYSIQLAALGHDLEVAHSALEEEREVRRELERTNSEISRRLRDMAGSLEALAGRL